MPHVDGATCRSTKAATRYVTLVRGATWAARRLRRHREAVLFLASEEGRWVNGHASIVDGGVSGSVFTGLVPAPEI